MLETVIHDPAVHDPILVCPKCNTLMHEEEAKQSIGNDGQNRLVCPFCAPKEKD